MSFPVGLHVNAVDGKVVVTFSQAITYMSLDIPQTQEVIRLLQQSLDQLNYKGKMS